MDDNNVTVLANQNEEIVGCAAGTAGGNSFRIVGINDQSKDPDVKAAMEGIPSDQETVLLAHTPTSAVDAADAGVGLVLSGHTHGGHMFPFHGLVWMGNAGMVSGLHSLSAKGGGSTLVYVSGGIVGWGPRNRFLSHREVVLLTLRSKTVYEAEGKSLDLSFDESQSASVVSLVLYVMVALFYLIPYCYTRWWSNSSGCRVLAPDTDTHAYDTPTHQRDGDGPITPPKSQPEANGPQASDFTTV